MKLCRFTDSWFHPGQNSSTPWFTDDNNPFSCLYPTPISCFNNKTHHIKAAKLSFHTALNIQKNRGSWVTSTGMKTASSLSNTDHSLAATVWIYLLVLSQSFFRLKRYNHGNIAPFAALCFCWSAYALINVSLQAPKRCVTARNVLLSNKCVIYWRWIYLKAI